MTMSINEVIFPILCIKSDDPMIYAFRENKKITTADEGLVSNGVFDNTNIFSSQGKKYEIVKVLKKGWATLLWGYNPLKKGRQIKNRF